MSLKKNLDVVIFEKLYEKVIRGEWEAGQGISPDEIAETYGVSRTPVVQALKRMRELGMLEVSTTGHVYVPVFSEKQITDLLEVRMLIEKQVVADIRDKALAVDFETLQKYADECGRSNSALDVIAARRADLLFHRALVAAADNPYLDQVFDRIQAQFIVANYLLTSHTQEQQRVAAEDHFRILDALRRADYDEAAELIIQHILGARDKILARMAQKRSA